MTPRRGGNRGAGSGGGGRAGRRSAGRRHRATSATGSPGVGRDTDRLRRSRLTHWRADGQPKVRFSSPEEANRFALQVRLEHGHDPVVYPCELCGGWHLGGTGET
jgi:hypothetical protein